MNVIDFRLTWSLLQAASEEDGSDGLLFMQEMIELSKTESAECEPHNVTLMHNNVTVATTANCAHSNIF